MIERWKKWRKNRKLVKWYQETASKKSVEETTPDEWVDILAALKVQLEPLYKDIQKYGIEIKEEWSLDTDGNGAIRFSEYRRGFYDWIPLTPVGEGIVNDLIKKRKQENWDRWLKIIIPIVTALAGFLAGLYSK